jgi:hypothetical protein
MSNEKNVRRRIDTSIPVATLLTHGHPKVFDIHGFSTPFIWTSTESSTSRLNQRRSLTTA